MNYSSVFFLENYLRDEGWQDREFFFDLLKNVIFNSGGGVLKRIFDKSVDNDKRNLFRGLAGNEWVGSYFEIPDPAEKYLIEFLPADSLVICYEMPEWMRSFLNKHKIDYIDIRLSPVRCSIDMMIAIKSNNDRINLLFDKNKINKNDIKIFISQVVASVRREQRYDLKCYSHFNDSLVFLGQTISDAALISPNGKILDVDDYASQIYEKSKSFSKIFYHAHPFSGEHAVSEFNNLEKIIGRKLEQTNIETYDLLACDEDISFIGISSGLLQESILFGKKSEFLYKPICSIDGDPAAYSQYYIEDMMNSCLWESVFHNTASTLTLSRGRENHLRKLHKLWFSHGHYLCQREPGVDFFQSQIEIQNKRLTEIEIFLKKIRNGRLYKMIMLVSKLF